MPARAEARSGSVGFGAASGSSSIRIDECESPIERVIGPFCSGAQLEELRHGLGPRILRCLVELHDGTLDAIPAGAGTTVTLRLPRAGSC